MFLEMVTLALLGLVVGVKYVTTVHRNRLNQRFVEAETAGNRNEQRYRAVRSEREAAEGEEIEAQKSQQMMEGKLGEAQEELLEQENRNRELTEQIESR